MGIRPINSGEQIVTRDVREELADDLTATAGEVGQPIGEAMDEIYATAQSANTSAGEIAARVKSLEETAVLREADGRIKTGSPIDLNDAATKGYVDSAKPSEETISGMGWSAQRWGKHVTLFLTGVKETFTLPTQFRPASRVYASVAYGRATNDSRVGVMTHGAVELFGVNSNGAYATVSYLTN